MKFVISSDYFCLYFQTHFEESSILLNNSNFAEVSLSPFYPVSVLKLPFLHFYSRPNIGSKPHIRSKIRIQIYDQHIYEPPDFLSYMVDHQIYVTAKASQETKYFQRCSNKSDAFIVFSQRHIFFKYSMLPRSIFTSVQRSFVGKSKEGRAKDKKLKKKNSSKLACSLSTSRKGVKAIICSSWCNLAKSIDWHNQ